MGGEERRGGGGDDGGGGGGGDVQLSVFELWDSGKTMPAEP